MQYCNFSHLGEKCRGNEVPSEWLMATEAGWQASGVVFVSALSSGQPLAICGYWILKLSYLTRCSVCVKYMLNSED